MPDNREVVSAVLVLLLAVCVVLYPPSRRTIPAVLRAVTTPGVLVPVTLYAAYAAGLIYLASRVGLWTPDLWWGTGLVVLAGIGLLAGHCLREDHAAGLVRAVARDTFSASVLLTLYVSSAPFSLPVELLVQLLAIVFGVFRVVATRVENGRSIARFLNGALTFLGIVLVWHTTVSLLDGTAGSWPTLWRAAALALWYPVGLLPFLYVFAYFAAAEVAGSRVRIYATGRDRRKKWHWTFRMLVAFRGSLGLARAVKEGDWTRLFARAADRRERRQRYAEYRAAVRAAAPPTAAPGGTADAL